MSLIQCEPLCRARDLITSRCSDEQVRKAHFKLACDLNVEQMWSGMQGLAAVAGYAERAVPKALSNIALALLAIGHFELALGYAVASLRIGAHGDPIKAYYRAAQACVQLEQPGAALYFLSWVRRFVYLRWRRCASCAPLSSLTLWRATQRKSHEHAEAALVPLSKNVCIVLTLSSTRGFALADSGASGDARESSARQRLRARAAPRAQVPERQRQRRSTSSHVLGSAGRAGCMPGRVRSSQRCRDAAD